MIISIVKALLIASVPTLLSVSNAAPNEEQSTGPLSAVHAFHAALAHGDAKAALALLAEDAVILEAGSAETRDEVQNAVTDIRKLQQAQPEIVKIPLRAD